MASNEGLDESVDFDFFETPRSPVKDFNDTFVKDSKPNERPSSVSSKPPVQPKDAAFVSSHSDNKITVKKAVHSESSYNSSSSDSESVSSDSASKELDESRNSVSSKSSVSVSSRSTISSLSSDRDNSEVSKKKVHNSKKEKRDSSSSSESVDEEEPPNLTAKTRKQNKSKNSNTDQESGTSEDEEKYKKSSSKAKPRYDDDGDFRRGKTTKKGERNKSQAWDEERDEAKRHYEERPKTAKGRVRIPTDSKIPNKSDSDTLSDSDMTDVSPMESPRHSKERKSVKLRENGIRIKGDGSFGKRQYVPITDVDYEDPDRLGNLDLSILMKAVGELEKQKRLKTNTRRVMFAPMSVNRSERGNYTFDDNQTREIERENNRLLKEIVRQVNSREHTRSCARTISTQKLTPSAVNRERDIRRIEMENLAILKRLKKVKPTKSISRENQLKEYESTMLHGVPIAALHPISKPGRRSGYDDSSSSMSSFTSGVSSVRSLSSRLSSRPGSAVRRPSSAKRYVSDRPDWSDRW